MADMVYASNWYNLEDIQSRKAIALVLLRTQSHDRLSAYGLYDLSMETFSKVNTLTKTSIILLHFKFQFLQKAYSFYALLRKM